MLLQLHLHSRLNAWLQRVGQRRLQDEIRIISILGFGASHIRDFTVYRWYPAADWSLSSYSTSRSVTNTRSYHQSFTPCTACYLYHIKHIVLTDIGAYKLWLPAPFAKSIWWLYDAQLWPIVCIFNYALNHLLLRLQIIYNTFTNITCQSCMILWKVIVWILLR